MGFEAYLKPEDQSYIITTFRYPADPWFNFGRLYERMSELGFVIYPGKLTAEPCFRIGTIGQLSSPDIAALLDNMQCVLEEMMVAPAGSDR
jgi:2-aminoethylphosphonate-pyruvate transaminase